MKKQTLFISYNWRDGNLYADELETQLKDEFDIKRDKSQLITNDDIFDFMAAIIKCDNVIIVLTTEYVKSLNCMLEMSYMFGQLDWKTKVTVLVIDESIYLTDRKLEIVNYWMERRKKSDLLLKETDAGIQMLKEEKEYIDQICDQVENFLLGVTRRKNPSQIAIVKEVIEKSKSDDDKKLEILEYLNEREKKVLDIISKKENVSIEELSVLSSVSIATAQRFVSQLKDKGAIEFVGSGRHRQIHVIDNK